MTPGTLETIEEAVDTIRRAPIENLRSPKWMEHEFLPRLGLGMQSIMPKDLMPFADQGVQSMQYPNQFGPYLCYMADKKIFTYAELGTYHGGTFIIVVEYLARFNPIDCALAIDPDIADPLRQYAQRNPSVTLCQGLSGSREGETLLRSRMWDLVFIDADHREAECLNDYKRVMDNARIVALHDVCNDRPGSYGATLAWNRIREFMPLRLVREFIEQYPEVLLEKRQRHCGIGVIDFSAREG